jgi:methylmalonyl-CoA mutase N-terminal domain/subunit
MPAQSPTHSKTETRARKNENTMPATIEAVALYATLGEICSALATFTASTKSRLLTDYVHIERFVCW